MVDKPSYSQVNESINSVIELTTRVDERVIHMMKNQAALEKKIDVQTEALNLLNTQFKILETQTEILSQEAKILNLEYKRIDLKVHDLEGSNSTLENRWKTIFGFAIQLVWVILAAFILYKLGIQAPAVP